ncbi:MAG: DNA repair protein RecN [Bacteroidota bacterium]
MQGLVIFTIPNKSALLVSLSIKNYALIDDLNVSFEDGFTTITGETGAGKSILLGALSLVLGKRADLSLLKDKDRKCTIEAEFAISEYALESFFKTRDLDYEKLTILRREILPSGKSRAFVNDTPANLEILSALGNALIDVHSQHQTLQLTENAFQFKVVDALAGNRELVVEYRKNLALFRDLERELQELSELKRETVKELDYNSFLLDELEKAPLKEGILETLETEHEQLNNVETLLELLAQAYQLLHTEQMGILEGLTALRQATQKLAVFGEKYQDLNRRIEAATIELDDITSEFQDLQETVEPDPERLLEVDTQLAVLHNLLKKHQVTEIKDLIEIKETLGEKVQISLNIDEEIQQKQRAVSAQKEQLDTICADITENRNRSIPRLKDTLEEKLSALGMPSAEFQIEILPSQDFNANGKDVLSFLFSANKGSQYGELKKVASGGELSRIMLAIKAILAKYEQLPTLMFDEIDTGVSGEISNTMGAIMKEMGHHMQVFSITHLPQVASKGKQQFKVFKEEDHRSTSTRMKLLSTSERIEELAEMLGGKSYSESAENHARTLLAQG